MLDNWRGVGRKGVEGRQSRQVKVDRDGEMAKARRKPIARHQGYCDAIFIYEFVCCSCPSIHKGAFCSKIVRMSVWVCLCVCVWMWVFGRITMESAALADSSSSNNNNDNKLNCQIPKPDSTPYIMAYACYLRSYKAAACLLPALLLCALPHTPSALYLLSFLSLYLSLSLVILLRLKLLILLSPKLHIYASV